MEGATVRPVHFAFAETNPHLRLDNTVALKKTMRRCQIQEDRLLTNLEPISLNVRFIEEAMMRNVTLLASSQIWVPRDQTFVSLTEARKRYPGDFIDASTFALPPGEVPFTGDPFDEDTVFNPGEALGIPAGISPLCPLHRRLFCFSDSCGTFYCSHPACWARYRFLREGEEREYPEVWIVSDSRNYLPDLSASPVYVPAPTPDKHLIPLYPTLPVKKQRMVPAGQHEWREFAANRHSADIAQVLKALEIESFSSP